MTCECLESFRPDLNEVSDAHIVLVDNGSGDNSVEAIERYIDSEGLKERITFVKSETNLGFSAANNLAIKMFPHAPYVLLANSDILILEPTLKHCLEEVESNKNIGAYSCRVIGPDDLLQNNARSFPTPVKMLLRQTGLPFRRPGLFGFANTEDDTWDRDTTSREVDWLSGCFLLLRRTALDNVGLLDEDFFFYGEDLELCHRIRKAGFSCWYDHRISIKHFGGGSSDPDKLPSRRQLELKFAGEFIALRKCHGWLASFLVYLFGLIFMLARKVKIYLLYPRGSSARAWADSTWGALVSIWRRVLAG
jgi:GT2 family glycosyltransferase